MLKLEDVKGVGAAVAKKLRELGIQSVFGLFSFFPTKYVDLHLPVSVRDARSGQFCLLEGKVISVSEASKFGKHSFSVNFKDSFSDGKINFKAVFFNQPYLRASFEQDVAYRLLAKPDSDSGAFSVVNPICEKADKVSKLDGVFTVYPLRGILGQNTFKNIVYNALNLISDADYVGATAKINRRLATCFESVHRPKSVDKAYEALEELASLDVGITLSIYRKNRDTALKTRKVFYKNQNSIIIDYKNSMPYVPTASQNEALEDVRADLASLKNMSRIINGDVGSGKTVVAFFALYAAAASGFQAALIAPTEILAKQHFDNFAPYAEKLGLECALLTSGITAGARKSVLNGLKNGNIDVVIGTQALTGDDVVYKSLTLAVIDEQHRFGVNERAKLEQKGACDVLSLTATPIPRSMALTFYDDIAVSRIEKRSDAQTNVSTEIEKDICEALRKISDACKVGKQAFIVCPAINDSEGYELYSIESFWRDYASYFGGLNVSFLHGKFSDDEKDAVMREFCEGKTDVLIATTVIEVGIDTKACEILILNADHFGLASLHQLRGRVGRDGSDAHCYLHCGETGVKSERRLTLLRDCNDGQILAENDFEMRGAGDFIGTKQSGASHTVTFGLNMNAAVLEEAKRLADGELSGLTADELVALTRKSRAQVEIFINNIKKVTLNS